MNKEKTDIMKVIKMLEERKAELEGRLDFINDSIKRISKEFKVGENE